MQIITPPAWDKYSLLDSGNGKRFERFGQYSLVRPDPQALWRPHLQQNEWHKADATFDETGGRGRWITKKVPEKWEITWNDLTFYAKLSPFKHTGIFPEQTINWEWLTDKIANRKLLANGRKPNILNLFAYTGGASLVCAKAGASVTHVDASKPTIGWARENQTLSGLDDRPIRWILDDAMKFVEREVKRGLRYDGIIMDPPVYGHGPNREVWDFTSSFPELMNLCRKALSDTPMFVLINAYAISASSLMLENVLADFSKGLGGTIEVGELALQEEGTKRLLSTGIFGRWSK
ncbi:class I SAM-dependent methyltransferase [soil metagenome]